MWRGALWILLSSLTSIASAQSSLHLETNLSPPYQQVNGTRLTGESVDTVHCILNKLGLDFSIDVVPWKRAQSDLQNGQSDGYFSAIPQPNLDAVATLTAPIVLEKWFWFAKQASLLRQSGFPAGLKVGVLRGSNQEEWLQGKGIRIAQSVNQLSSLLKLLEIGRIDAFLVDEHVFRSLLSGKDAGLWPSRFERYVPMGLYFSNRFLALNPDFINQFNSNIPSCAVSTLHLTSQEEEQIRAQVDQLAMPLLSSASLHALLVKSNQLNSKLDMAIIHKMDEKWMAVSDEGDEQPEWMKIILGSPESRYLHKWQDQQQGLFREILLTDSRGLLVASSEMTTDYYQGDEEKVIQPLQMASSVPAERHYGWFDRGDGHYPTALIDYDASTHHFLVHISYLIRDGQHLLGVLCFGIDLEVVLRSQL